MLLRCLEAGGNPEESARVDGQLRQLEIRAGRSEQLLSDVQAAPNEPEPRFSQGAAHGFKVFKEAVDVQSGLVHAVQEGAACVTLV